MTTTTLHTRASRLMLAGWAGLLGPVLFTVVWVAQELSRIEEYSPVQEPVSALAAGPNGWIQSVSFAVFGVLTIVFALGLLDVTRTSRLGAAGSALFLLSALGPLLAQFFPMREDAAGVTHVPVGHTVGGMIFFLSSTLALVVISFDLTRRAGLRTLGLWVRAAGVLMVVSNPVMVVLVTPDDAPLHEWAGLAQRIILLGLMFPARIALSYRMLLMPAPSPGAEASVSRAG